MKRLRMGQEQKAPRAIRLLRERPWWSVNGTDEGGKPRDDFLFWPDH
jgi:hypothetical protein